MSSTRDASSAARRWPTRRRPRSARAATAIALAAWLGAACASRSGGALPGRATTPAAEIGELARGHAHNDYVHPRPLLDALDRGFGSVEADVHLVGGELLVAHHRDSVESGRTLERLYLAPLRARLARRSGGVLPERDGLSLLLLIDAKSEAESTYAALEALLRRYGDVVTAFAGDSVTPRPVVAVLSGNRALGTIRAARVRHVALDGRLPDLYREGPPPSPRLMPLVSDAWDRMTSWRGDGAPPAGLRDSLVRVVTRAHATGRKVRFWGTPDREPVWRLLRDSGVDLINADDLDALRAFLLHR